MNTTIKPKQMRGFAVMSKAKRVAIARLGGVAISKGPKGRARMRSRGRNGGRIGGKVVRKFQE